MVKQDLQDILYKKVKSTVETIIDKGFPVLEVFDELCNRIDPWAEIKGYKAYIRVFWYNDSDPDEMLDDVADIWNRFNIDAYCNYPSTELDACFTVMLYKEIRDEDVK